MPFPFTDLSGNKPRPAIIISNSKVNKSSDVIIAQITSTEIKSDYGTEITNEVTTPFRPNQNGDVVKSFILFKKIVTIDQNIIKKKITSLKSEKLGFVLKKINELIELE